VVVIKSAAIDNPVRIGQEQTEWCWAAASVGILSSFRATQIVLQNGQKWPVSQPNLALIAFPGSVFPQNQPIADPARVAQVISGNYVTSFGKTITLTGYSWGGYYNANPTPQVAQSLISSIKNGHSFLFACGVPAHAYLAWRIDWEEDSSGNFIRLYEIHCSDPWPSYDLFPVYKFYWDQRAPIWGGVWVQ
jgi:hypothetical protein